MCAAGYIQKYALFAKNVSHFICVTRCDNSDSFTISHANTLERSEHAGTPSGKKISINTEENASTAAMAVKKKKKQ